VPLKRRKRPSAEAKGRSRDFLTGKVNPSDTLPKQDLQAAVMSALKVAIVDSHSAGILCQKCAIRLIRGLGLEGA
jgi:hypothetical protein